MRDHSRSGSPPVVPLGVLVCNRNNSLVVCGLKHKRAVSVACCLSLVLVLTLVARTLRPPPVADIQLITATARESSAAKSVIGCTSLNDHDRVMCAAMYTEAIVASYRTAAKSSACIHVDLIDKWIQALKSIPAGWTGYQSLRTSGIVEWDILQPFVSCPGEARLGYIGDGGKWTCLTLEDHKVSDTAACTVYSFGVRTDSSFEDEMATKFGCDVFEFDPSPNLSPPAPSSDRIKFNPWGLRGKDETFPLLGANVQGYSLATIQKKLGHTGSAIDVLKVDIEESEWDVLSDILFSPANKDVELPFHQLLVELHFMDNVFDSWRVVQLVVGMLQKGFLPFHKELNGYDPKYTTEVSFVSLRWLAQIEPACAAH
jgi:hypothetical protein